MEALVQRILALGARLARPGEFSERAYINDKIDLVQAEAVADLINASSKQASKAAMRSLQGDFSRLIEGLVAELIHLRMYIEAGIDFPDEEIDLLKEGQVFEKLAQLNVQLHTLFVKAENGLKLSRGIKVVIAGKPNAGKSSILNRLSGMDSAIVTHIPGTTRDLIKEEITLDGLVIQLIDTAGLRETQNEIEQEGIKRTTQELALADHVIWVMDISEESVEKEWESIVPKNIKLTVLCNKIDTLNSSANCRQDNHQDCFKIYVSAKTGEGIPLLLQHLKKTLGMESTGEGNFLARKRHIEALILAKQHLDIGIQHYQVGNPELLAEELRLAQKALDEITGKFTSDDLLGKIFSEFCIGK
jgi:tRNA modification GTPase